MLRRTLKAMSIPHVVVTWQLSERNGCRRELDNAVDAFAYFEPKAFALWAWEEHLAKPERKILNLAEPTDFIQAYNRATLLVTLSQGVEDDESYDRAPFLSGTKPWMNK